MSNGKALGVAMSKPSLEGITLEEGADIATGTTTGTSIGTSVSQKIAFYGATPIVKATITLGLGTTTTLLKADVLAIATALSNLGLTTVS